LLDFGLHHGFDERFSDTAEQIAQAGLCQLGDVGERERQLDGSGTGEGEFAEILCRTAAANLVCFLQSDSPSLNWEIAQSVSPLWARVATFYELPDILTADFDLRTIAVR
jgi:hypothetical protein